MMWAWLASLITGPIINAAIGAYKAKLDSGNTSERIAADLAGRELDVQRREAEVRASVVIAEQGHWFTRSVRPLWAMPFVLYTWKIVVYDKMMGWGETDPLGPVVGPLMITVAAAYFGGRTIENVARIIRR